MHLTSVSAAEASINAIPSLSYKERAQWSSWFKLHQRAIEEFNSPSFKFLGIKCYLPFPWRLMQMRSQIYVTKNGLETSCGITAQIALSSLLGPKKASELMKTKALPLSEISLKTSSPTLFSFCIDHVELSTQVYGGHAWTILQANHDHYLLISSYLFRQKTFVREMDGKEMETYLEDLRIISDADEYTTEVDEAYERCFSVSHPEFEGAWNVEYLDKPLGVYFRSTKPNLDVDQIQHEFHNAIQTPFFPETTIIRKGVKIPNEEIHLLFEKEEAYWFDSFSTVGFSTIVWDYITHFATISDMI